MTMALDYDGTRNAMLAQKCAAIFTMAFSGVAIIAISVFSYRNPDFSYSNPSAATGLALSLAGLLVMLIFGGGWYLSCRRCEEKR